MNPAYLVGLAVAIVAAICDLRSRRIPNVLTFGAALAALAYHLITGGPRGLGLAAAGWFVGAIIFLIPFALRGLGGGDLKLLAALGAWVGPADALWLALYTGVAGGVMAIVVAVFHGYLQRALQNVWLLLCHLRVAGLQAMPGLTLDGTAAPKLAYALPILMGMVGVVWLR